MVESSDVIRTYDVLSPIDLSATLSRVAAYSRLIDAAGSRTALSGERPFVIAGRNPNGSLAVAALPRCVNGKLAAGEVDIEIGEVLRRGQQLAVFGAPRQLRIRVGSDTADFRVADLATGGSLRRPSVVVRDGWLTLMANGECKSIVVSVRPR